METSYLAVDAEIVGARLDVDQRGRNQNYNMTALTNEFSTAALFRLRFENSQSRLSSSYRLFVLEREFASAIDGEGTLVSKNNNRECRPVNDQVPTGPLSTSATL